MRAPQVSAIVCLAASATAACGTFGPSARAPAVREVRIGGSDRPAGDGYYADAYRAIVDRDYGRALDLLQLARRGNEKDPRVLNAFGVVYDKLGRFDLSARYYAEALAADPQSAVVQRNLAYSQELQRHWLGRGGAAVAASSAAARNTATAGQLGEGRAAGTGSASLRASSPVPGRATAADAARDPTLARVPLMAPASPPPPLPQADTAAHAQVLANAEPKLLASAESRPQPGLSPPPSSPGPRPYAVAFPQVPTASLASPPAAARPAPPALVWGASWRAAAQSAPLPAALTQNEPAKPLALAKPSAGPAARPATAVRTAAGLIAVELLDASGQLPRALRMRARLAELGWSAAPRVQAVAPPASRTVIRYPVARARIAKALARTLPGPAELQACGRSCNFIQVRFGADIGRWPMTPEAPKRLQKG